MRGGMLQACGTEQLTSIVFDQEDLNSGIRSSASSFYNAPSLFRLDSRNEHRTQPVNVCLALAQN